MQGTRPGVLEDRKIKLAKPVVQKTAAGGLKISRNIDMILNKHAQDNSDAAN